jgi:amino acid adenylation domain-containing protein
MEDNNSFDQTILSPLLSNIYRFSNRNAFCIDEVYYSYKEFGDCISKIRPILKELYSNGAYIGLVANDDLETYASIFALWLEGKCYIPLHPNQPIYRSEEIIKDMNINLILDSSLSTVFTKHQTINTSTLSYDDDSLDYHEAFSEERTAYVLFTSGSTGKPKGVSISRKNLTAFIDSFWNCGILINEKDRCLQCFDLTFDVSIQCFLVPLLKGACVYTIPHNQIKYSYASALLEDHQLTVAAVAPSMLRYLKPYFEELNLPALKYCILAAEASPLNLIEEWKTCIPNAEIYNFYGPTEATIYCTYYQIKRNAPNRTLNGMIPIGIPMKGVEAIIVDEGNNILPAGKKGELCVAGNQVCVGYWNDPEKNRKAFFEKQYNGTLHRFYRTGDLCYYDNESILMLFGRIDSQAKIQGYRVELGEIEFHAREYLDGTNAVCLTFNNPKGNTELSLFVEHEEINQADLIDYMKSKLPHYMIPTKIILEKRFPLNSNSKVDKKRLKEKLSF